MSYQLDTLSRLSKKPRLDALSARCKTRSLEAGLKMEQCTEHTYAAYLSQPICYTTMALRSTSLVNIDKTTTTEEDDGRSQEKSDSSTGGADGNDSITEFDFSSNLDNTNILSTSITTTNCTPINLNRAQYGRRRIDRQMSIAQRQLRAQYENQPPGRSRRLGLRPARNERPYDSQGRHRHVAATDYQAEDVQLLHDWMRQTELEYERRLRNLAPGLAFWPVDEIHHDALPVDDPRRFNDVSEFIQRTLLFSCTRKTGLQTPDPHRDVYKHDLYTTEDDIQGIDWATASTTRSQAIDSRQAAHHHHYNTTNLSSQNNNQEGKFYDFRSYHARHKASCSHYQLRNVLTATSRSQVLYASGTRVYATNLAAPSTKLQIMDFAKPSTTAMPFKIICLSSSSVNQYAAESVVIAGGFNGEYAVMKMSTGSLEKPQEGIVTQAYNGLVTHISTYHHRRSGNVQAAFCTNDCRVRTMDVPSMKWIDDFTYDHAINATAMSPDGRIRLLVGDHHNVMLTDVEKGTALVTLKAHTKDAFACAWSPDGKLLATGAQDGKTVIWDVRSWNKPLTTLDCVNSCVRSLHFTNDNLLAMAENDDIISFYDSSTTRRQDIKFFGSIAGLALLEGGEEVVVANSDVVYGGLLTFRHNAGKRRKRSRTHTFPFDFMI